MSGKTGLGAKRERVVAGLCPDAELAEEFSSGKTKLIPMVFCHGNKSWAEDYYA